MKVFTKYSILPAVVVASILFWTVYYYFSNQNPELSILLAALDTVQYTLGYYLISLFLLPNYLAQRKIVLLLIGFFVLSVTLSALRVFGYQFSLTLFNLPFKPSISTYIYLFTTTFLILIASSSVKFAVDWLQSQKKIEKINRERKEAELEFLKGQLNPHFLFNSINTLYGSIQPSNELARNILLKLSDILRYQLYECGDNKVNIEREIEYMNNYIELQRLRSNQNLEVNVAIDSDVHSIQIPPLLIAPLIENSFKHVGKEPNHRNWIAISLTKTTTEIHFLIENTFDKMNPKDSEKGIGIENIKKRLALLYENHTTLEINQRENIFSVKMELPIV